LGVIFGSVERPRKDRVRGRTRSFRAWLYAIATNACLRVIGRRPKRLLPIDDGPPAHRHDPISAPLVESVWIEPFRDAMLADSATPDARYELREAVELAFIAALQHLPARQRAVLILRDVLGFSARETAEALDTTSVSVDSALQRAHKAVAARLPDKQITQITFFRSPEAFKWFELPTRLAPQRVGDLSPLWRRH
jgi:RNA polymerase sigma-70 factor, ECF subfamily